MQTVQFTDEIVATARESLLFSSAPKEVSDLLLRRAVLTSHPQGTTVFAQDDPADAIFVVIEGWVKLYRIAQSGAEAVVGVFTKRHSFGEAAALRGGRYPVYAETVTDTLLLRIDARDLLDLLRSQPEVSIAMLTATFAHLHGLIAQIEQLKARTAPQRVAEFLLDLTKCKVGPCSVMLPYDKVLIAGRLGMKPESLSRAFSRLREHGVKIKRNAAQISDVETLRAYADGVNAWVEQVNLGARGRGAPEFFLYPDEIPYWEPADSLAVLKLLAASSTVQLRREVLRARFKPPACTATPQES